jgi:hypothetical protein
MATFTLEDTVKTFTYHEALVVYWFCEELSNENIAARHRYSKDWVVWQMSRVYYKLGLDRPDANGRKLHWGARRKILREKVCPILRRLINDDPELLDRFPIIPPNVLEGSILDLRPEIPVPPSGPVIPLPEPPPAPPPLPPDDEIPPSQPPPDFYPIQLYNAWLAVLEDDRYDNPPTPTPIVIRQEKRGILWRRILILGLFVFIGCAAVGALAYWLGQRSPPVATSLPSATSQTLLTASLPISPTVVFTETLAATEAQAPTDTLTPSPEPTQAPLFFTDFTNGKPDQLMTLYGSPQFVGGTMTFDEVTMLALPEQWTDFEVTFDLSNMECQLHVQSRGITVGLRYQDPNNMVALRIFNQDDCAATWFSVKDGVWNKLSNSSFELPPRDSNGVRHWIMSVQGNIYTSPFGLPVIREDFPTGGVALIGDPGVTVDNLRVDPLTP